ncbi:type III restriction-modification system endonuclease [Actinobacillus pleuropneumoniae]|uniref:type III restriction-modification system endonuclease n=1 Tax=Actinobacillus pleuropneumoniae TaxID=715 RepID=UPI001F21FFB3|nr:DEAD/DEAH box helicase family protein [Actinobacillus pleuropneumoniae]UKH22366.1 restriction endonuclease subunit R [Actinobacillus pleuropneumoniae]
MKLQFKTQQYQTNAVNAVVGVFDGQPYRGLREYRMDMGNAKQVRMGFYDGFRNAEIIDTVKQNLLANIQNVQANQNLPLSEKLATQTNTLNLDIEMETGTGKTYCYIKTIFELNRQYGWSKFVIIVPSVAIREGVKKSFEITADHFQQGYGKKARSFIYNSSQLHEIESFSSNTDINVMIINIQAFNASGKDNRRIYEELDDFGSRKPIDVLSANRPILILDEPQKMEGKKTLEALAKFNPLMILRYSATHKTEHNKIHRLDALDAYNQKLVKKIAVRGITIHGLTGTKAYIYLQQIHISSNKAPTATVELEFKLASGEISRKICKIEKGDRLAEKTGLSQYDGFVVSEIEANGFTVEFTNGVKINQGEAYGDVTEEQMRRIQIRETILAHFEKERVLFSQGIKVLSLFFIDEVAKYRDYSREDTKGEYARIFEEEYHKVLADTLMEFNFNPDYLDYLRGISAEKTHYGYFSVDKKSKKWVDPSIKTRGEEAGQSDDVDAYDLILKDKERLLSFGEKTRFIFSHSALREGWDNPNVFVLCMLKHSDNTISRRQEVGRGLRLAVNKLGERQDNPANVHEINVLTVIANESYSTFVDNLQKEINSKLSRKVKLDKDFFSSKVLKTENGNITINEEIAEAIQYWLIRMGYVDSKYQPTAEFQKAISERTLENLPSELENYQQAFVALLQGSTGSASDYAIENGRKQSNPRNANFDRKEFKALWDKINRKAVYQVDFDSDELIKNCVEALNRHLNVTELTYTVREGVQKSQISDRDLDEKTAFKVEETSNNRYNANLQIATRYDLVGQVTSQVKLTRQTVATILTKIEPAIFAKFAKNPEQFISEAVRLINEQKAYTIVEKLSYNLLEERFDSSIFIPEQSFNDLSNVVTNVKKHIYDYVKVDSDVERKFVEELDTDKKVVVYTKLPSGFFIPTPVGNYNPDWAISFEEGSVKHIYFIAETKGSLSSLNLKGAESSKIECARKFFAELSNAELKYGVVTDYRKLVELVN